MAPDDIEGVSIVRKVARAIAPVVYEELAQVDAKIEARTVRHEAEYHRLPPRRTRRVTAVPFPDWELDDTATVWAIERLAGDGWTLEEAAAALGVPALVLDMAMHDYWPHYQEFKAQRAYR